MNNPFLRLKRYSIDGATAAEAKENYATESLAACLVFSSTLREEFIRFLFNGKIPSEFEPLENVEIDVTTQEFLGKFGYADLLLRSECFVIIVEVKVNAKEDERHAQQLADYWNWLEKHKNPFLFTLVKDPNNSFDYRDFHVRGRHTWRELFQHLKNTFNKGRTSGDGIIRNLVANFCEYLESEAIVTDYEIKNLLSYSEGLKAQKALEAVFSKVTDELVTSKSNNRFDALRRTSSGSWPRLEFRNPSWSKSGKQNQSIWLWFMVPPIWDAKRTDFLLEIILWFAERPDDNWRRVKPVVHQWRKSLESQGFELWLQKDYRSDHKRLASDEKIELQPVRIYAFARKENIFLQPEQLSHTQSESDLVALLAKKVRDYGNIIDQLSVV